MMKKFSTYGFRACRPGALFVSLLLAAARVESVELVVHAGGGERGAVPVSWDLGDRYSGSKSFSLWQVEGGKETPVAVQLDPGARRVHWIVSGLKAGSSRSYRLFPASERKAVAGLGKGVECVNDGKNLLFSIGEKKILRYNHAVVKPPGKPDPAYDRGGYIHPVWTPSGKLLTNDFPPNHKHHHGIWFPWTNTEFEGRHVDFWNSGKKQGRIEVVKLDGFGGGAVFGWFSVRHRFLDLTAPGGAKPALEETWNVKVYAIGGHFLFDLDSTQKCSGKSPLKLNKYRYGGLGFRGSHEWEGPNAFYLTSEGKTRKDGHHTAARWCEIYGKLDGVAAGISILCHPKNFRAPQNMRIHPGEPFFNYAPCQNGDFSIEPGKDYVSRYRFYVHDGGADAAVSDRLWTDYAVAPKIEPGKD